MTGNLGRNRPIVKGGAKVYHLGGNYIAKYKRMGFDLRHR